MRIAILKSNARGGGGLEKYCARITEALLAKGHDVSILSTSSLEGLPVRIVCCKIFPSFIQLLWFDFWCRWWLLWHPQDVVFGFDRHFVSMTHYRAGNGCHKAYLQRRMKNMSAWRRWTIFCNPLHILTLWSERRTFTKTPVIICNSHLVQQEILYYYPSVSKDVLHVVHNGVEWHEFSEAFIQKELMQKSLSAPPHIVCVGHEWFRKGVDRLIDALALIKNSNFLLTVIGKERHPEIFVHQAKMCGVVNKIRFYPMAKPSLPFYQASQIAVIPSRYDPFANVTLEALAMGLFVITTASNGGSEAIDSTTGIVLDDDADSATFSQAIETAFSYIETPNIASYIRNTVKTFDFATQLQKIVDLIEA